MTPQLAIDSRSFLETIDDLIAKYRGPLRVAAETDAVHYSRHILVREFSLVPIRSSLVDDDSISSCEQVMTCIAARLIASGGPVWANHDWNKPIALLGYLLAERKHHRELVARENARSMANVFMAAE